MTAADRMRPERAPGDTTFRDYLIEWARDLGRRAAYCFEQPSDQRAFLSEQLHGVRDIIPNQDRAFEYLMKQVQRGYDDCYGWSWCLRGVLRPLFERRASKEEIEKAARLNQGALPDYAVVNLLKEFRAQYWDQNKTVIPFRKYRKHG